MTPLRFAIPGRAKSAPNLREHWAAKARRVQTERRKAMTLCPRWPGGPLLVVTLCRYGVRQLDSDNLQAALKATRDGIAARLKVDDATPLVDWRYAQAVCRPGEERVEVVVTQVEANARE
jgi:hypothetical protein